MKHEIPTWLGITSPLGLAGLAVFVFFGFRQGFKIKTPPQGVPPEVTPPTAP